VLLLDLSLGFTAGALAAVLRDQPIEDGIAVIVIAEPEQFDLIGPGAELDDIIVAPLNEDEVALRVGRVLWQRTGSDDGNLLRRGGLVIDQERYTVRLDGEVVDLTYKEYELLRFLASNAGKAFTREALLNQVWGYDYYGGSRTVDVHIRRIRSKIEGQERFIDTVRNVGYRFVDDRSGGAVAEGA
jgi:DNA-binding response OmpR family regulator